jgi:glycosyltransferase involved in cell wall biosynthesis
MKLLMHDYGSYPYPWELSVRLAERGHRILHIVSHAEPLRTTPHIEASLADRLEFLRLDTGRRLNKKNFIQRRAWGIDYGRKLAATVARWRPECIVSANSPLDAQKALWKTAESLSCPKLFWLQDILGRATRLILHRKLPVVGRWIGVFYEALEKRLLRESDHVVAITDGFIPYLDSAKVASSKRTVVENWAPIAQLPMLPKENSFSREFGLEPYRCFIYAGQLGMKHNPNYLVELAERLKVDALARLVVAATGPGLEHFEREIQSRGTKNCILVPFQPFERVCEVMGSADVLVALLENDAGQFCVPSKVLTYLCSGKPILFSAPIDNLAGQIIDKHRAGIVCPADDLASFLDGAQQLLFDDSRSEMGKNGRTYAETHFGIDTIADRFARIIERL